MGFLDKLKQAAGIGGVKVSLELPESYSKEDMKFTGKVILSSQSDQNIKNIKVNLQEVRLQGIAENTTEKEYILGEDQIADSFEMKAGEEKNLEFSVPFSFHAYELDRKIDEKLESSLTRKLNDFADLKRSKFTVSVLVEQEGTMLPITVSKSVKITGSEKGNLSE